MLIRYKLGAEWRGKLDADGLVQETLLRAFVYLNNLPNGLKIQFLDSKWLQEQVQQNKSLSHYDLDGHPIITGTTAEMQDFFSQFGLNEQARSEPVLLRRMK